MGLYEQIRDIAKAKGYSINKLEQELGFARSSINKFNKNKPSIDKLQQIADFLDVSVDYLTAGKENDMAPHYYLDDDARDLAQFMFENPEYKVLFDASRKVKKEDIEFVRQMIDRVRGDSDDTGC